MLKTLLRDETNQFCVVEDPSAISEIVQGRDRLLWLDLERPTQEEFALIREEFGLHPLAIEDAMSRHQRPKVDFYDSFYLVIFYTVAVQEAGRNAIPGRRGLSGSSFVRSHGIGEAQGDEKEVEIPKFAVHREGEQIEADEDCIVLNELTLFLGENFLITVHDNPIPELDEAARRWTQNVEAIRRGEAPAGRGVPGTRRLMSSESAALNSHLTVDLPDGDEGRNGHSSTDVEPPPVPVPGRDGRPRDVGILLYSVLDTIVDNYFPVIDSVVDRVELIEEQIFERNSQNSLQAIFNLKKDLLALRRVLSPERDVLNVLTRRDLPIFDNTTTLYFQDVYDHVVRVTDSIDIYRDLLSSVLDGHLSMQSNRLNVTVQTLTAVSIILMSVAAITGWYGMNFTFMPELNSALGYPGVIIIVIAIVLLEVSFFKRKGWL
jgi:Mg2+ and Co2+ transporter CorA